MNISNESIFKIIRVVGFLILDLGIFVFCGVFMMGYDDFYNENQGEYFSFSSMTIPFKIVWAFYNVWLILNCVLLLYFLFKLYKKMILKKYN